MKQLSLTTRIIDAIKRVAGSDVDTSNLVVFETIALNTKPLKEAGGLHKNARVTRGTLEEMAAYANGPDNGVHLHTLHQMGYELPVGRVFAAEIVDAADGVTELRALFYIDRSSEKGQELINSINNSVIDEVSVTILTKHALCSECGFDFHGPEATLQHVFAQTCDEGHTVGQGSFVRLSGMSVWHELSLVSRGAADGAKILSRSKSVFASESGQALAASGSISDETPVLFTHLKLPQKDTPMKLTAARLAKMARDAVLASFSADATDELLLAAAVDAYEGFDVEDGVDTNAVLDQALSDLKAELSALNPDAAAAAAEEADLEGVTGGAVSLSVLVDTRAALQLARGEINDLKTQLENHPAEAELDAALTFLKDQAARSITAAGLELSAPTDVAGCIDAIKAAQTNLAALPVGGVALAADAASTTATAAAGTKVNPYATKKS